MATLSDEERKARNREYNRVWRDKNRDKYRRQQAEYRVRNRDKIRARHKLWVAENVESNAAHKMKHYLENKDAYDERAKQYWKDRPAEKAAHCANRRARKKNATPPWANLKRIERIYMLAAWASKFTKERLEVDHIHPLTSDVICGLHCEDNLQILPASENYSKSNKFNVC